MAKHPEIASLLLVEAGAPASSDVAFTNAMAGSKVRQAGAASVKTVDYSGEDHHEFRQQRGWQFGHH